MPVSRSKLDRFFVTLEADQPVGQALSELLNQVYIVVKDQDPQSQEPTYHVLLGTALTHVIESTLLGEASIGRLHTVSIPETTNAEEAQARANNLKDIGVVLVLDEDKSPLGVLPAEDELILRPPQGQVQVQCATCGKWIIVSAGPGPKACPIYGHVGVP